MEKFKEGRYRNKLRLRSRSVPRLLEDRREDRSEDEVTLRNEMNNLYDVDFGAKTKKDLVKVKRYNVIRISNNTRATCRPLNQQ